MLRRPTYNPYAKRESLAKSLSLKLFVMAGVFSLLSFALLALGSDQPIGGRLVTAAFSMPILCALITPIYLWNGSAEFDTLQAKINLAILRLGFWVGTCWQLICGVYLALEWASSSGFVIWFPS